MEQQPTIRTYHKDDKIQCLSAFKSNVPLFFTEEEIGQFESFLDHLTNAGMDEKQLKKTHFYVVLFENKIIGCGGFGDKDQTNILSLAWGLIHREFHKKGFGELLLTYRLEQIKILYPTLSVVVDTTQYSYGFFEKYGFRTIKITNDFYTLGMHRYDMTLVK